MDGPASALQTLGQRSLLGHRNETRRKSSLVVENRCPMMDEIIDIKINSLDPNEKVTLRTEVSAGEKLTRFFKLLLITKQIHLMK